MMNDSSKEEKANAPLVSIIVLNYNGKTVLGPEFLSRCLSSVLSSEYQNFQVIFFDNRSADGSVEFVRRKFGQNPSIKIVSGQRNYGFALGSNQALSHAQGKYIVLLNNDVEVHPRWLQGLANVLETDSSVGIAQSKVLCLDRVHVQTVGNLFDPSLTVYLIGCGEEDKGQYNRKCEATFACGAALMTRRSLINNIGLFDPNYFWYHDDSDLSWRARLAGFKVVVVPSSIIYHKGMGTSERTFGAREETFYYLTSRFGLFVKNFGSRSLLKFGRLLLMSMTMDSAGLLLQREGRTLLRFLAWIPKNFKENWKNRMIVQKRIRKVSDEEILKSFLNSSLFVLRMKRAFGRLLRSRLYPSFDEAVRQATRDYYLNHLYNGGKQNGSAG
jgi:GT2 family glycosyltransferase